MQIFSVLTNIFSMIRVGARRDLPGGFGWHHPAGAVAATCQQVGWLLLQIFSILANIFRPQYSLGLSPEAKLFVWDCILQMDEVAFYKLEQPRGDLELYDRCYYKNIWR